MYHIIIRCMLGALKVVPLTREIAMDFICIINDIQRSMLICVDVSKSHAKLLHIDPLPSDLNQNPLY